MCTETHKNIATWKKMATPYLYAPYGTDEWWRQMRGFPSAHRL